MSDDRFKSFTEFWPFYVREHKKAINRKLHFAGTTAALATLATAVLTKRGRVALLAPVFGYGAAWVGHFLFEKNRPATFKYPLWSLRGDFVMYAKMWAGKMDAEVERCTTETVHEASEVPPVNVVVSDDSSVLN